MLLMGVFSVDKLSQSHALVFSWITLSKNIRVSLKIQTSSVIRQMANLKTDVSRKQRKQNFPKKNISYPQIGGKKCSFLGKFGVLCFLVTFVLRFALLPYYLRYI